MIRIRPKPFWELAVLALSRFFALIGVFAAILQLSEYVPGAPEFIAANWLFALYAVLGAGIVLGMVRIFQPVSVSFKARGTELRITVKTGDLFAEAGSIAIPVNDFFDTEIGQPVSANSVHGQFLQRMFPHQESRARSEFDAALAEKQPINVGPRPRGNIRRYRIGETAVLDNRGHSFVLFALSETDALSCEVRASPAQLVSALASLWDQVRACCNHNPVSVPLIGAGSSRTGLSKLALVDFLLTTAVRAHKVSPITTRLTLVLRDEDLDEIDLFDVQRRYG